MSCDIVFNIFSLINNMCHIPIFEIKSKIGRDILKWEVLFWHKSLTQYIHMRERNKGKIEDKEIK
jgi:hypothetical protein